MPSTTDDLLDSLLDAFANPIDFPFAAVAEAKANWGIVGRDFIDLIEGTAADPLTYIESELMWFDFASRLASDMRDTRAFAPLVAALYLPEDAAEALMGDALTDNMGRILACTFDPANSASEAMLRAAGENRHLYIWCRFAAIEALCIRAHEGDADIASVKVWLHALCAAEVAAIEANEEEDETAFVLLVTDLVGFAAIEYLPDIERWRATLGIGRPHDSIENIRRDIAKPYDRAATRETYNSYTDNITEEFATWATFTEKKYRDERNAIQSAVPDYADYDDSSLHQPYVRETAKVGRNDPCSCGSGLKFKKCCGKNA
jgi:hypothetical protein